MTRPDIAHELREAKRARAELRAAQKAAARCAYRLLCELRSLAETMEWTWLIEPIDELEPMIPSEDDYDD